MLQIPPDIRAHNKQKQSASGLQNNFARLISLYLTRSKVSDKSWEREVNYSPFSLFNFFRVHIRKSHMKYSFAELGITSNIHPSALVDISLGNDENDMKVDENSMIGQS